MLGAGIRSQMLWRLPIDPEDSEERRVFDLLVAAWLLCSPKAT